MLEQNDLNQLAKPIAFFPKSKVDLLNIGFTDVRYVIEICNCAPRCSLNPRRFMAFARIGRPVIKSMLQLADSASEGGAHDDRSAGSVCQAADRATRRATAADRRNTHRVGPPGNCLLHKLNSRARGPTRPALIPNNRHKKGPLETEGKSVYLLRTLQSRKLFGCVPLLPRSETQPSSGRLAGLEPATF